MSDRIYSHRDLIVIVSMIHGSSKWCDLRKKHGTKSRSLGDGEHGSGGVEEDCTDYRSEEVYPLIDQARLLSQTPALPHSPTPHLPNSPAENAEANNA